MAKRRSDFRVPKYVSFLACVAMGWVLATGSQLAAQDDTQTKLIEVGDLWTYFKGIEEPDPDWNQLDFDDGDWEEGEAPFGYGDTGGRGTPFDDMQNSYLSGYFRHVFAVEDLASIKLMVLRINYDDGVVVYLNGEEVARLSMPGTAGDFVPFDTTGISHESGSFQSVVLGCEQLELLSQGENLLAIQGHNLNLTSSDFVVEPELIAVTTVCPTEITCMERTNGDVRVRWRRPFTAMRYDMLELRRNGELLDPQPRVTSSLYTDRAPLPGKSTYELTVGLCGSECKLSCPINLGDDEVTFRRGDVDDNDSVNINDAIVMLNSLFKGAGDPVCPDAADANDDAQFNLSDPIFLLGSLFQGTDQPPDPGVENCGADPSEDQLAECTYGGACG